MQLGGYWCATAGNLRETGAAGAAEVHAAAEMVYSAATEGVCSAAAGLLQRWRKSRGLSDSSFVATRAHEKMQLYAHAHVHTYIHTFYKQSKYH